MAQIAKIIDITRSFFPTDPDSFASNLMYSEKEDSPETAAPILAYEGYNFLPTSYGYRSFFGISSKLNTQNLPPRCDEVILFQLANRQNILIALAEDGIHYQQGTTAAGAWIKAVSLAVPPALTYSQWTYCLLENTLYFYRQGEALVYKLDYDDFTLVDNLITSVNFTSFVPTFLNMTGQMGIFRANGRLGFWDSANSISWSNLFDVTDFIPSLETLAGNSTFNAIIGRIVQILSQKEGFTVYCTKSIVGVRYSQASIDILWESTSISSVAGIFYAAQVTQGLTESEHFVFSSAGILRIGEYNALSKSHKMEQILPEVYDLLRESRNPVALEMINGRFLCFLLTDLNYIDGRTSFERVEVPGIELILKAPAGVEDIDIAGITIEGVSITVHIAEVVLETLEPTFYINYETSQVYVPGVGTGNLIPGTGAVTIELPGDINGGFFNGMYTQWNASGRVMYKDKLPGAMKPYVIDSEESDENAYKVAHEAANVAAGRSYDDPPYEQHFSEGSHIPNIGLDLTKTISNSATAETFNIQQALVDNYDYPNFEDGHSFDITLSWTYPGMNNIGIDFLGKTDSYLNQFIAAQRQEWANLATIQSANLSFISSLIEAPVVKAKVNGVTVFTSSALAQANINNVLIPVFIAGKLEVAGSGNTRSHKEVLGSILSGARTETGPTFAGVGGNYASMELKAEFLGGTTVKRKISRAWTINVGAVNSGFSITSTSIHGGWNFPVEVVTGTVSYEALQAELLSRYPSPHTHDTTIDTFFAISEDFISHTYLTADGVTGVHNTFSLVRARVTPYIIDFQDTLSLELSADATVTLTSTATASQRNLTWGYSANSTPENTYTQEGEFIPLEGAVPNDEGFIAGRWVPFTAATITAEWKPGVSIVIPSYTETFNYPAIFIPGIFIEGYQFPDARFTFPGANFLLQKGAAAPIYPDYQGFLCLDVSLKKWGKCKAIFRALIDYQPINYTEAGATYSNFGADMAMLNPAGEVRVFDAKPAVSYLRYGKIGFYRLGMTQLHEVTVNFRLTSSGFIEVDTSIDGRALSTPLKSVTSFNSASDVTAYLNNIGKWHTIKISGNYDLQFIEVKGTIASRR